MMAFTFLAVSGCAPYERYDVRALEEVKQLIWANVWPSFKSSSAFESWRRSKQHKCFVSSLGSKLAARRRRQPSALEQAQLM